LEKTPQKVMRETERGSHLDDEASYRATAKKPARTPGTHHEGRGAVLGDDDGQTRAVSAHMNKSTQKRLFRSERDEQVTNRVPWLNSSNADQEHTCDDGACAGAPARERHPKRARLDVAQSVGAAAAAIDNRILDSSDRVVGTMASTSSGKAQMQQQNQQQQKQMRGCSPFAGSQACRLGQQDRQPMNGVQRVEAECDKEEEIIKRKMDVLELRMQYETKKNALYEMQLKVSHACTHTHMYTLTLCLFLYTYKYACMHMETCTQPRVSRVPKSEMDTYEMQWKVRCACTNTHTHTYMHA
jgi:hypothetical protein